MRFKHALPALLLAAATLGAQTRKAVETPGLSGYYQTSSHTASFTWTASLDGGLVSLYRAPAACSTNPTNFTSLKTGLPAGGPGSDATVTSGAWCYYVTAVVQGLESPASNKVTLTVSPQPPTGLSGTAN